MRLLAILACLALASCALSFPDKSPADGSTDGPTEPDSTDALDDGPVDGPMDGSDAPDIVGDPGCGNGHVEPSLGEECDEGTTSNCDEPGCTCTTDCRKPWLVENDPDGSITFLLDVWTSGTEAIAVGAAGVALHRDTAGTWTTRGSGTTESLEGIHGFASNDVIAVGWNSTVIHWDGTNWTPLYGLVPTGGPYRLLDIDCWMTGPHQCFFATNNGWILLYQGGWSNWPTPVVDAWHAVGTYFDTSVLYGYAVGNAGQLAFYTPTPTPDWHDQGAPLSAFNIFDVLVVDLNSFYVVADAGRIHFYNGSGYALQDSGTSQTLRSISRAGNLIFAVGDSGTILVNDTSGSDGWVREPSLTSMSLRAVSAAPGLVVAVGERGIILRRQ